MCVNIELHFSSINIGGKIAELCGVYVIRCCKLSQSVFHFPPVPHSLVHTCNLTFKRWKQGNQEFRASLSCIINLRPVLHEVFSQKKKMNRKEEKKMLYQSFSVYCSPARSSSDHHTLQICISGYLAHVSLLQCALAFDVLYLHPHPCLVLISHSSSSQQYNVYDSATFYLSASW